MRRRIKPDFSQVCMCLLVTLLLSSVVHAVEPVDADSCASRLRSAREISDGRFVSEAPSPNDDAGRLTSFYGRMGDGPEQQLGTLYTELVTERGLTVLKISSIEVHENARGLGIATQLYKHRLDELTNSGLNLDRIESNSIDETNLELVLRDLMKSLSSKPGYQTPRSLRHIEEEFSQCCRKISQKYPDLVLDAVRASPAYRIRAKLGYPQICKGSLQFKVYGSEVFLNFASCR